MEVIGPLVWKLSALGVIPGDGTEVRRGYTHKQGRVGEERGGKETDGCPLTGMILNMIRDKNGTQETGEGW
jgi:hypothetical protein